MWAWSSSPGQDHQGNFQKQQNKTGQSKSTCDETSWTDISCKSKQVLSPGRELIQPVDTSERTNGGGGVQSVRNQTLKTGAYWQNIWIWKHPRSSSACSQRCCFLLHNFWHIYMKPCKEFKQQLGPQHEPSAVPCVQPPLIIWIYNHFRRILRQSPERRSVCLHAHK